MDMNLGYRWNPQKQTHISNGISWYTKHILKKRIPLLLKAAQFFTALKAYYDSDCHDGLATQMPLAMYLSTKGAVS